MRGIGHVPFATTSVLDMFPAATCVIRFLATGHIPIATVNQSATFDIAKAKDEAVKITAQSKPSVTVLLLLI